MAQPDTENRPATARNVQLTHEVLAALQHCALGSDPEATPVGFEQAQVLGLVEGVNPVLTPLGRGVLRSLGVVA